MNLVSFALRRPISLLTMVVAVALVGFLAVDRMSRDIFPDLGVPVLYVAQPYGGMDPAQMEGFIVNYSTIMSTTSSTSPASSMSKANQSRA